MIVVGAGLAGLAAAAEAAEAGRTVLLLDAEPEQSLGGQAWWSFGGLFFVDSPEQRRLRISDSVELAWQDWTGTAGFDRPEDELPGKWARAYVEFAATEKRSWLRQMGHSVVPVVGWAERGGYLATGHGNSVPRFHITWGTGRAEPGPYGAGPARHGDQPPRRQDPRPGAGVPRPRRGLRDRAQPARPRGRDEQDHRAARVLRADGTPVPGLYAAGEAAGFGGGGMHGYRSLEGTFLGGCLFSGRAAGRAAAEATAG